MTAATMPPSIPPPRPASCAASSWTRPSPLEGADVRLNTGEETATGPQGQFSFGDLRPGEYFVQVELPGYTSIQTTAAVVAGVAEPPLVKIVVERLEGKQPYIEVLKFQAFFECHFALPVIVDNCDMAVRTVADGLNETVGNPGVPRGVQQNENTAYYDVADNVEAIVQEAFWDNPEVSAMMILLSSTPIDNLCDCSERDYMRTEGPSPTLGRIEGDAVPAGETVAARGFLPFGSPQVALNHEYVIITTMFHDYIPDEGWNFEDGEGLP